MTTVRRRVSGPLLALLAALALPIASPAPAQTLHDHEERWASDALGEVAFLGINALVGGLTAGVWQELSEGSFEEGFAGGALGGSVAYAGKRIAAESFPGAGLLGRDVAAVGSSVVRNAADARPLLDSLALPVGPLRLYLSPRDPSGPRVEADVAELYWITYGLVDHRLELDVGESVSSGAFVFDAERPLLQHDEPVLGVAAAGVVFLSPGGGDRRDATLAHERAHVLQQDFIHHAWFRPLEDHLARKLPAEGLVDTVDYDVLHPGLRWTTVHAAGWDGLGTPLQAEAEFLEDR